MKRAQLNVMGDFGDKHWVSDLLLTAVAEISQLMAKHDITVVYVDSLDNGGVALTIPRRADSLVGLFQNIRGGTKDILCILYSDPRQELQLADTFAEIRRRLPFDARLWLHDVGAEGETPFTDEQRAFLLRVGC